MHNQVQKLTNWKEGATSKMDVLSSLAALCLPASANNTQSSGTQDENKNKHLLPMYSTSNSNKRLKGPEETQPPAHGFGSPGDIEIQSLCFSAGNGNNDLNHDQRLAPSSLHQKAPASFRDVKLGEAAAVVSQESVIDYSGSTPHHVACMRGNQAIVQLLTDSKRVPTNASPVRDDLMLLSNTAASFSSSQPPALQGATALASALLSNTVSNSLNLDKKSIGTEGSMAMAKALESNTTLETLCLPSNSIGVEGATALARALESNTMLKQLDLFRNSVGDDGAAALARALESNTSLKWLHLCNNSIGNAGATCLARALESNTTLETLSLDYNSIGNEGATALARALESNTTLIELSLNENSIGNEGAVALARALELSTTLKTLRLAGNSIGNEGVATLSRALEAHTTVRSPDVSRYTSPLHAAPWSFDQGNHALVDARPQRCSRRSETLSTAPPISLTKPPLYQNAMSIPSNATESMKNGTVLNGINHKPGNAENQQGKKKIAPKQCVDNGQPSPAKFSPSKQDRVFIEKDEITDNDVLCGRGFKNSSHPGNEGFFRLILENARAYDDFGGSHGEKTRLSTRIVREVTRRSGRFLADVKTQYYLLTQKEARQKVGTALRDALPLAIRQAPNSVGIDTTLVRPRSAQSDGSNATKQVACVTPPSSGSEPPLAVASSKNGVSHETKPPSTKGSDIVTNNAKLSPNESVARLPPPSPSDGDDVKKPAALPLARAGLSSSNKNSFKSVEKNEVVDDSKPAAVDRVTKDDAAAPTDRDAQADEPGAVTAPEVEAADAAENPAAEVVPPVAPKKKKKKKKIFSSSSTAPIQIEAEDITERDVLCGREFAGSDHPGNVLYLQMIENNKARHHAFGNQHGEKTAIRNAIVQALVDRGGRFVRKTNEGEYHLLTLNEARSKTSQALRENKNRKKLRKAQRKEQMLAAVL